MLVSSSVEHQFTKQISVYLSLLKLIFWNIYGLLSLCLYEDKAQ